MKRLALGAIGFYQRHISAHIPGWMATCRYEPTCSRYGAEAIELHGFWAGGWLTFKRLMRCGPWGEGGEDPVPDKR